MTVFGPELKICKERRASACSKYIFIFLLKAEQISLQRQQHVCKTEIVRGSIHTFVCLTCCFLYYRTPRSTSLFSFPFCGSFPPQCHPTSRFLLQFVLQPVATRTVCGTWIKTAPGTTASTALSSRSAVGTATGATAAWTPSR